MAKGGDLGVCPNIFRFLFIIFNGIYMIFGLAAIAVGIYSLVVSETYGFITGNDTISGASISIVVGSVLFIVSIIGILGALFRWRPMLVIYAIFWSSLIVLEVIGAVLSFYYGTTVSAATREAYRDGWTRAIEQYTSNPEAKRVIDAFQKTYDCCGLDNASDWTIPEYFANNTQLPSSCQCTLGQSHCAMITVEYDGMNYTQAAYNRGCYDSTVSFFQSISIISGAVTIVFAIFEVLGVIIAIGLVCCITRVAGKYEVV